LHDPKFSCFGTVLDCDRQTDGHTATAYTTLASRNTVKT